MEKRKSVPPEYGRGDILRELFTTFFKIGAFTFGGGYAMIALLENEFIERRGWMTKEEFLDMVAIAESTPGPVAINSATFIGYRHAGFLGALVSTVAVSLPSFVVIYLISLFFDRFLSIGIVASAFHGIRVCVVYLIASAGLKMLRGIQRSAMNLTILLAVVGSMITCSALAVNFSTMFYILISGALGVMLNGLRRGKP